MAEFTVMFTGNAFMHVRVEAETPEDAEDKAYDMLDSGLCFHCSHPGNNGFGDFGPVTREWPGEMQVASVEDENGDTTS